MAGRPTVLTAAVYETLVKHVREGAFDWVAAEAAGISQSAFYSWMKRGKLAEKGQRAEPREEAYVRLRAAVRQARALARIGAEKQVRRQSPLNWLRMGPGKEREGEPGWTQPWKGVAEAEPEEGEVPELEFSQELIDELNRAGLDEADEEGALGAREDSGGVARGVT